MPRLTHTLAIAASLITGATALGADATEQELIETIAQAIENNYVYPEKGTGAGQLIRDALERGDYETMVGEYLASSIRRSLVDYTQDLHFGLQGMPAE
ncbi:unnamed protein product, partial [Laminaria digitata]